jgi:hypothetical protein
MEQREFISGFFSSLNGGSFALLHDPSGGTGGDNELFADEMLSRAGSSIRQQKKLTAAAVNPKFSKLPMDNHEMHEYPYFFKMKMSNLNLN